MRKQQLAVIGLVCTASVLMGVGTNRGVRSGAQMRASISEMLDDFHDAAAKADAKRYFGHFAENAVFLGTDPTERWTLPEFRAWAQPYFQRNSAWIYHAVERHVEVSKGGDVGWFDEVVRNEKYGDLRGSGVVLLDGGEWKIAQYNLTFTVPNDAADLVLKAMKDKNAAGH